MRDFEIKSCLVEIDCQRHGKNSVRKTWIFDEAGSKPECPACLEEKRQVQLRLAQKQAEELQKRRREAALLNSGIPERHKRLNFANFDQKQGKNAAFVYNIVFDYAQGFKTNLGNNPSLLFSGGVGTGKTMLSCLVAKHIIGQDLHAIYTTAGSLFREYKATFGGEGTEGAVIEKYARPDLLIVDEIGVQYGSDTERNVLYDIVNRRYERMRPTIIISNLAPLAVQELVGERVLSRLQENGGGKIIFDWDDYRTR